MRRVAAAVVFLLLTACGDKQEPPSCDEGQCCGPNGDCPVGFLCTDQKCVKAVFPDAGAHD